jgi:hypothetical protein
MLVHMVKTNRCTIYTHCNTRAHADYDDTHHTLTHMHTHIIGESTPPLRSPHRTWLSSMAVPAMPRSSSKSHAQPDAVLHVLDSATHVSPQALDSPLMHVLQHIFDGFVSGIV